MPHSVTTVLLSVLMLANAQCRDVDHLLSGLAGDERLEVWFASGGGGGFGGGAKYYFTFTNGNVEVFHVTETRDGTMTKSPKGAIKLDRRQIEEVDRMFTRYRGSPTGKKPSESLSVEIWRGDKRITKEILVDTAWVGLEFEGEIRPWDLIESAVTTERTKMPNKAEMPTPRKPSD